jgi:hypothetical protein
VETTKKTSTTKAALLVIAALSMLLSGLFIATASRSDASPSPACPDSFSLTADAKNCFQAAVVSSADNPNSCDTGQLTPDGTKCFVAARIIPQAGQTLCPKGYSPDDSLGSMCARFDAATQGKATCPAGSRGAAGGCYILVAKGPSGAATCADGTLVGTNCVITGTAPVNGASTCPVSTTVISNAGECYTLIAPPSTTADCLAPYVAIGTDCYDEAPEDGCPATHDGQAVTTNSTTSGGGAVVESCTYTPAVTADTLNCPAGTTADANGVDCRRPVDLTPGAATCATGFGILSGKCIRYEASASGSPQCPVGSIEDASGDCRKPVADAKGAYSCADANAALNGKSCVWTAGFLITPSPSLYKCDAGARTVLGIGAGVQVICILGAANANTTSGPSCLQGVLSTDNAYCIVTRIDAAPAAAVAAPVPSFTG